MKKIIHPCDVPMGDGEKYPMFCKIEIRENGELLISGVIGPDKHGNAKGGCGQIEMEFDHLNKEDNDKRYSNLIKADDLQFASGWDKKIWYKFLDIWKHWHLNHMNSVCEHQESLGWTYETHRGLYVEAVGKNERIQNELDEIKSLLETCPPDYIVVSELGETFKLSSNGKLLKFNEYKGHLCPICGYSIGSSWLKRELPKEVIEFLSNLPETDREPTWV